MPSKLLGLGNPKKVIEHLRSILDGAAIDAIEVEMAAQVSKLYALGIHHYKFAEKQSGRNWRQRVSRLYYSAYAASRATRLQVHGHFSVDVKDHQKIGDLPDDFPNKALYSNRLDILREDRNTCDYDHASVVGDLLISPADATILVRDYLIETRAYLEARGQRLRGRP